MALICFFLAYGPYSYFRELLVTTAMTTMSHKYLAYILYSEETVKEILDKNKIVESGESTDTSAINTELAEDTGVYESIYEEQILKRDEAGYVLEVQVGQTVYEGETFRKKMKLFQNPLAQYGKIMIY